MDLQHTLVPIALFVCVTYAFKAVLDAIMRYRLLHEPGTEELLHALLAGEAEERRTASLRWGILLVALAIGFGVVQAFGWTEATPGAIGVLAGSFGLGHLLFHALTRRSR